MSSLLRRARAGEVIVIAHAGQPVAKLGPLEREIEVYPGIMRLSVFLDDEIGATPTRSSPEAST